MLKKEFTIIAKLIFLINRPNRLLRKIMKQRKNTMHKHLSNKTDLNKIIEKNSKINIYD